MAMRAVRRLLQFRCSTFVADLDGGHLVRQISKLADGQNVADAAQGVQCLERSALLNFSLLLRAVDIQAIRFVGLHVVFDIGILQIDQFGDHVVGLVGVKIVLQKATANVHEGRFFLSEGVMQGYIRRDFRLRGCNVVHDLLRFGVENMRALGHAHGGEAVLERLHAGVVVVEILELGRRGEAAADIVARLMHGRDPGLQLLGCIERNEQFSPYAYVLCEERLELDSLISDILRGGQKLLEGLRIGRFAGQ